MKKERFASKTACLMLSMLRVGLIGFGGGNALIPLIESEAVNHYALITKEEYEEDVLVASITPGALPVEIAGGIGRRCAGTKGLFLGSFALALPGVVLTLLLSSVITLASGEVLMQIRFLAVGVTAFIACLLTQYIIAAGKQGKGTTDLIPARAMGEGFFVKSRRKNAGILCGFQVFATKSWRKRPVQRRRRDKSGVPRETGIAHGSLTVTLLVFAFTCGKNVYRLLGIDGKPPLVLSTIQVFAIAFVWLLLFGKRDGEAIQRNGSDKTILIRTAKELGYLVAATALFLLAAYALLPETVGYAAKGFLSSLMSFGGGDAYLTVADGLFVQTGLIEEGDFYNYLVPIVNILPGSILCKTLAGVGYFLGYERTGSAAGGFLVAMTGFLVSLLASCGVFDVVGCFHERFRDLYVIQGIKRWIRPIVSGLMLTVILSLIVQNRNLGIESGLGVVPLGLMLAIYGLDLVLMYCMKMKNGSLVFLSALCAFIVCNLMG